MEDPMKKAGPNLRSSVLHQEMMKASANHVSQAQMKRMERMKEFADSDKARNLNLKKLKEATQEIKNGVSDGEKFARK